LSRDTLSVLAQGSHTVSLFAAMLMEQIWAWKKIAHDYTVPVIL
jgi:hypothetical protein